MAEPVQNETYTARKATGPLRAELQNIERAIAKKRREAYGTNAPTTGPWSQGDVVWNLAPGELGVVSSKYVIQGWICTASGTPGTWVQMRTLTGN